MERDSRQIQPPREVVGDKAGGSLHHAGIFGVEQDLAEAEFGGHVGGVFLHVGGQHQQGSCHQKYPRQAADNCMTVDGKSAYECHPEHQHGEGIDDGRDDRAGPGEGDEEEDILRKERFRPAEQQLQEDIVEDVPDGEYHQEVAKALQGLFPGKDRHRHNHQHRKGFTQNLGQGNISVNAPQRKGKASRIINFSQVNHHGRLEKSHRHRKKQNPPKLFCKDVFHRSKVIWFICQHS